MNQYPEILHYLGRYHVVLLHLPIGCIAIAFLMELVARFKKVNHFDEAIRFILFWSFILAFFSSTTGYLLSLEGGYNATLLDRHFWLGWATTALTYIVYFLKKRKPLSKITFPLFIVLMGLLMFTGHVGGTMTHGADHLNSYRPILTPFDLGTGADATTWNDTSEVFTAIIQPIFKEKCTQCHNKQKVKGGLLLTNKEEILKGGDNGPFLQASEVDKSLFLQRIHLPIEEKEHMPPRGKSQVSSDEIKLLEWWVETGASFNKRLADLPITPAIQKVIDRKNERPKGVYALDISNPNPQKLNSLKEQGVRINRLAQNSPFLQLDLSNEEDLSEKRLKKFRPFAKQIIDLDMAQCAISVKAAAVIAKLPHLVKLHLQKSTITDKGLKKIAKLKYLEQLNLYGTNVTDKGLKYLSALKNLKALYLWQTNTSDEAIQQLKAALPDLQIISEAGVDVFAEVQLNSPELLIYKGKTLFSDTLSFKLKNAFKGVEIYYTLNGEMPDSNSLKFQDSIMLNATANLKAIAIKEAWANSELVEQTFIKANHLAQKVTWNKPPSEDYPGQGSQSTSDLKRGGPYTKSPQWMGWQGSHTTCVMDYGSSRELSEIFVGYMENTNAWVFAPKGLKVWTSKDGKNYQPVLTQSYKMREDPSPVGVLMLSEQFDPIEARYVKVKVESVLKNPDWHLSPGDKCWLFIDEIIVQ